MKFVSVCVLTLVALVTGGQASSDVDESPRKLDAVRTTPKPTRAPTTSPTKAPSFPTASPTNDPTPSPTISHQPSISLEPTIPNEECDGQLPFCWDGSEVGRGRWGYAKCFAIESTEHCTSYDFQIAGQTYSTNEIIDFSHCASVWTWFLNCIEYSFPTCAYRESGGTFSHKTYSYFKTYKKTKYRQPTKYVFQMGGTVEDCYADDCNVGAQYWDCDNMDDAKAIYAFARWVAGYRDGKKKAADSLFAEPDDQCATPAPSQSFAPTSSPAPTYDVAPDCSSIDQPDFVPYGNNTDKSNQYYMPYDWYAGQGYGVLAQDSICIYRTSKTKIEYEEPLPWIKDAAARADGAVLVVDEGKLTGVSLDASTIILDITSDVYSVTIKESEALVGGDLKWEYHHSKDWKNKDNAKELYKWLVAATEFPLIWQTIPDQGLFCGSGTFCYDKNPHVRSYVKYGGSGGGTGENCGTFDFIIDDGEGYRSSTGDVWEWFMESVDKAFGCTLVKSGRSFGYKVDAWMSRWYDSWKDVHYVQFGSSGSTGQWQWTCPTEEKAVMFEEFFQTVEDARLFGTQHSECTEAPTSAPTACTDSFFTTPPLNILLVVDTSYSTVDSKFKTYVGDQNNDGEKNTIMDAEIAAAKALLNTIIDTEELTNDNVNIGLVLFDTEARYIGNFQPTNDAGTAINDDLLTALTSISIELDPNVVIDTNLGFTNMDDALDKAILYFEDSSKPVYDTTPTNLMVFMGDGKPNVRGDGDGETTCSGVSGCDDVPADLVDASLPAWEQSPLSFCTSGDTSCDASPYKKCVLGETCLDDSQTKQYDSELSRLDDFNVHRLSIGVGSQSDVSVDSALWIIDNNAMKLTHGILPRQVLDADDLITALAELCPENTPNPTNMPSSSPTKFPTTSPSASPTTSPTTSPTSSPSASPTVDFCDYNVIDFETLSDGETPVTSGYAAFPLEWEAYGLSVRAQPYDESDEGEDEPSPVAARYDAVATDAYTGMTLVVPQEDASNGGDLIITLDQTQEKGMELYIWNAVEGGSVSAVDYDGNEVSTAFIKESPGEMQIVQVSVSGVYAVYVSFPSEGALAQLNVCRDPSSTPAPVGLAPPSGSVETRSPTEAPTAAPSTSAPTVKDIVCPDDIKLEVITPEGGTPFEFPPLSIVKRDSSEVTLELTKAFSESVSYVYIEYVNGRMQECVAVENFLTTSTETIVAQCMKLAPVTVVNLYVADPSVVTGDAEIPECCHHPEDVSMPVVEYTFRIACEPQCPE